MVSLEEEHEPIVERIIHRLVRKHIAGTTMDSAIDAAKDLNSKNIPVSLTFLSSNVVDKAKAKYITTTYSELVRRIARSGLKAGVHIPIEQLGGEIDSDAAMENFNEIVNVSNKYGVFLWVEAEKPNNSTMAAIAKMKGVGIAINEDYAESCTKYGDRFGSVKLMFKDYVPKGKTGTVRRLEELKKHFPRIVLSHLPDKSLKEILKSKQKNDVVVEFEFGYSEKKIGKALKRGANVSMLVPFGKDWIKYAMDKAPEGYMRFVAGKLLKEGEDVA